jgi:multiple sugar transport system permease protein
MKIYSKLSQRNDQRDSMNRKPWAHPWTPYILIAPLVLFVVAMLGYPFVANLIYSLSDVSFQTLRTPRLEGFTNYLETLRDPSFWSALWFSLRFAVVVTAFEVLLGLGLALLLEPLLSKRRFLLAFLLLPMMISPALMGVMYRLILNDFVGIIPQYLKLLGLRISLLAPDWILFTLILIEVLQWTPFAFLILFTSLQALPGELTEAAKIDGARSSQILRFITLPMMLPAIAITSFIRLIDSFRVFDHIYVLTGGGPGTLTTSISIYIYKNFFQQERLGEAVAASILLLVMSLVPLWISMRYTLRSA